MCNSVAVYDAVKEKIERGEAFTAACISHPIIETDQSVRHYDVSQEVKSMWQKREMVDQAGTRYLRTLITVWPNGSSGASAQAYLYYPDNGYDPNTFDSTSRILVRNKNADTDGAASVVNAPDGSPIRKQCQVQPKDRALNIPKVFIDALRWMPGDEIEVSYTHNMIRIDRANSETDQKVDQEGRIRLYGKIVEELGTASPTVMLVKPDSGPSYLLISQLSNLPSDAAPPVTVASPIVPPVAVPGSVWAN